MRLTRGWVTDSGESYRALTADYLTIPASQHYCPSSPAIDRTHSSHTNLPHGDPKVANFPAISANEAALTIADTPGC